MNRLRKSAETLAQTRRHEWGTLQFFAGRLINGAMGVSGARVVINRAGANTRHSHPTCEEVLYLLQGHLRHYVGDQAYEMAPGDCIAIPAGVPHYAINTGGEDADMIVMYSAGERDFKVEAQPAT